MFGACFRNAHPLQLWADRLLRLSHWQVRFGAAFDSSQFAFRGLKAGTLQSCARHISSQPGVRFSTASSALSTRSFTFKVKKVPARAPSSDGIDDEALLTPGQRLLDDVAETVADHAAVTDNALRVAEEAVLAKLPRNSFARIVEDSHHSIREADLPAPVWFILLELREAGTVSA